MFSPTPGVLAIMIAASFFLEQQGGLCSADDWGKEIIVSSASAPATQQRDDSEPGFWASFRTFVLGEHDADRHGWHRHFFNRYIPLFALITLTLVAVALCLSYWCQDRNSPDTESSRAYLEELRRIQQGECLAMYQMPPSNHSYGPHPDYRRHDFYHYPPPHYNYATFDGAGAKGPPPSAPPAYQPQ